MTAEGSEVMADFGAEQGTVRGAIGGGFGAGLSEHPLFVGFEEAAEGRGREQEATALDWGEVVGGEEGLAQGGEHEAVGDGGAEGLDEVESERGAIVVQLVEVSQGDFEAL